MCAVPGAMSCWTRLALQCQHKSTTNTVCIRGMLKLRTGGWVVVVPPSSVSAG